MGDIIFRASKVVIDTEDLVALGDQLIAQMRSEKASPTGDKNSFHFVCLVGMSDNCRGSGLIAGRVSRLPVPRIAHYDLKIALGVPSEL